MSYSTEESEIQGNTLEWLKSWVKTTRIQTAMVTTLALWAGYITITGFNIYSFIALTVIGLCSHISGFTQNEVFDYEYDKKYGEAKGHPIANGIISRSSAMYLVYITTVLSIIFMYLISHSIYATLAISISHIFGYMYNKNCKKQWWSNIYLSCWVFCVVIAGALYAGVPNIDTILLAIAISIQIFTQVMEGDIKDITGPENTMVGKLGTKVLRNKYQLTDDNGETIDSKVDIIKYSRKTSLLFMVLKLIELIVLILAIFDARIAPNFIYVGILYISSMFFIYTAHQVLYPIMNRDIIKKKSAIHELTSIFVIGIAIWSFSKIGAIVAIVIPILWYILVNYTLHSSSLAADI